MSVSISNLNVTQGTGDHVTESVLEIDFDLAMTGDNEGNPASVAIEFSVDGENWYGGLAHASTVSAGMAAGTGKLLLMRLPDSLLAASLALDDYASMQVRIQAVDEEAGTTSSWATDTLAVDARRPTVDLNASTLPQYVNGSTYLSGYVLHLAATAGDGGLPATYRASVAQDDLLADGDAEFRTWGESATSDLTMNTSNGGFTAQSTDGTQYIYVKVYDDFYNESLVAPVATWLQKSGPQDAAVRIIGTMGHGDYTGISVGDDGQFTVDRSVELRLHATSGLPMTFKVLSNNVEPNQKLYTSPSHSLFNEVTNKPNVTIPLVAANATPRVHITTSPGSPTTDNFDTDTNITVQVQFADAAGNTITRPATIRLNTRIYQTAHSPLRPSDSEYEPVLREVLSGAERIVPRTQVVADQIVRTWPDIHFPESHAYPKNGAGAIDAASAIAMAGTSTLANDAVILADGEISLDGESRPLTADWSWDKRYPHMLSSNVNSLQSWVIDNTGRGEYRLEFEYFDLDTTSYGPPFNPLSPYRGDVLVVYDATTDGALEQYLDTDGQYRWRVADTTKLVEMAAYTGSAAGVVDLSSGTRMNSNPNGGFRGPWIRGVDKIVLILYTDSAGAGSGFRLFSSPAYQSVWTNWHLDNAGGEMWVHKHSSLGNAMGASDTTPKRLVYDYFESAVEFNLSSGEVEFAVGLSGGQVVTADYSYYSEDNLGTNLLLASDDDFVDYLDAAVYVGMSGHADMSGVYHSSIYESDGHGRMTLNRTWDKDRGVLELAGSSGLFPVGRRYFADYSHHTYTRIANDGFGDLTFRDRVLVADTTPQYPDFSWRDVKIVNEGDTALESGQIKFVARGYDTDANSGTGISDAGGVDQVLDINRPWDVQRGTRLETFDKLACAVSDNYQFSPALTKTEARALYSQWKDQVFGSLLPRSQKFGRVVLVLGGASGSSYPATTSGEKRCSVEVAGRYFTDLTF